MTAETKHTAGPWVVRPANTRIDTSVWTADGVRLIAQTVRLEDAPLIAAAPDLLAALKAAKDFIGNGYQPPELVEQMHAAIARAEGRS